MWECKDKPFEEEIYTGKLCKVEKCPMEHWIDQHINGHEWEWWVTWSCHNCPLKELKEKIDSFYEIYYTKIFN